MGFSGQIKEEEMKGFPHLMKWIERIALVSDYYMEREVKLMRIENCCPEKLRETINFGEREGLNNGCSRCL